MDIIRAPNIDDMKDVYPLKPRQLIFSFSFVAADGLVLRSWYNSFLAVEFMLFYFIAVMYIFILKVDLSGQFFFHSRADLGLP